MKKSDQEKKSEQCSLPPAYLQTLRRAGYEVQTMPLGVRPGGTRAVRYPIATKDGERLAISVKTQETPGSTQERLLYEIISFAAFLKAAACTRALIICRGKGWTLREFFANGLRKFVPYPETLQVISETDFLAGKKGLL